jgi:hypothetical protein
MYVYLFVYIPQGDRSPFCCFSDRLSSPEGEGSNDNDDDDDDDGDDDDDDDDGDDNDDDVYLK